MKPINRNTLFYGDNLPILREYIQDESVDLIYLDPPFNSSRSYNVLFKDESGKDAESQITAFEDTWHWGSDAQETYNELVQNAPAHVSTMISALREFIGANQMMAYLVMMTARLIELQRVLKPTGSIYLHCDPTASHYLKIVLDTVFGFQNYINEIVWKRTTAHNTTSRKLGDITDTILCYGESDDYYFNPPRGEHSEEYVEQFYRFAEPDGRRYRLHQIERNQALGVRKNLIYEYGGYTPQYGWMMEKPKLEDLDRQGKLVWTKTGRPNRKIYIDEVEKPVIGNLWDDIPPIQAQAAERIGYPTQKPLALLERIIRASSKEGDVLLDPFCGCGTAVVAAEKLHRKWIGIDVTHLSISLMKYRLKDSFNLVETKDFDVIGEPESIGGARQLASDDRYQFQWWALSLVQAKPLGGEAGSKEGKKGSDKGIDGVINFINEKGATERVLVQVKSGHVSSRDIRDLRGVLDREKAAIGVFITLEPPSRDMITEAVSSDQYYSNLWGTSHPRVQILTIEELLNGKSISMPRFSHSQTFKKAEKFKKEDATQADFFSNPTPPDEDNRGVHG